MEFNDFCCPLCGKLYDKIIQIPRLLVKCGHTFCHICITKSIQNQNEDENEENQNKDLNTVKFTCPEDKTEYENLTNIEELPINLYLLNLMR